LVLLLYIGVSAFGEKRKKAQMNPSQLQTIIVRE
jgi:hypothetical protein